MEMLLFPHREKQLQAGDSEVKSSVSLSDLSRTSSLNVPEVSKSLNLGVKLHVGA